MATWSVIRSGMVLTTIIAIKQDSQQHHRLTQTDIHTQQHRNTHNYTNTNTHTNKSESSAEPCMTSGKTVHVFAHFRTDPPAKWPTSQP